MHQRVPRLYERRYGTCEDEASIHLHRFGHHCRILDPSYWWAYHSLAHDVGRHSSV